MSKLYFEILDLPRKQIFTQLPFLGGSFVLAGGTALALQLGHRFSYDFDLFSLKPIASKMIFKIREIFGEKIKLIVNTPDELSLINSDRVKISLVHFPFLPLHRPIQRDSVFLAHLDDLATNKAYVIGRRGEYRDYVDVFFLLKNGLSLSKIILEAKKRFAGAFSERLFLEQLVYFTDLKDFKIDFLSQKYSPREIQAFLVSAVKAITH